MRRRAVTLLEVVVGIALLGVLGLLLVQVQAAAVRIAGRAEKLTNAVRLTEQLIWEWSAAGVRVDIPATGQWTTTLGWRREVEPIAVSPGLIATLIRVVVSEQTNARDVAQIYRVEWLVAPREG